jgi:hypothetical protein
MTYIPSYGARKIRWHYGNTYHRRALLNNPLLSCTPFIMALGSLRRHGKNTYFDRFTASGSVQSHDKKICVQLTWSWSVQHHDKSKHADWLTSWHYSRDLLWPAWQVLLPSSAHTPQLVSANTQLCTSDIDIHLRKYAHRYKPTQICTNKLKPELTHVH